MKAVVSAAITESNSHEELIATAVMSSKWKYHYCVCKYRKTLFFVCFVLQPRERDKSYVVNLFLLKMS